MPPEFYGLEVEPAFEGWWSIDKLAVVESGLGLPCQWPVSFEPLVEIDVDPHKLSCCVAIRERHLEPCNKRQERARVPCESDSSITNCWLMYFRDAALYMSRHSW